MKRYLLILLALLVFPFAAFAEEEQGGIALEKFQANSSDLASVKRGATFFAANCMSCHTMVYLHYDKLAQEAGVTYEKMPVNVKNWPYGVTPPDLSLEADVRGEDWIYTYLHSFYQDPARPTGVNNLLVPNTAMPGIISPFQGTQVKIQGHPPTALFHQLHWYDLLILQKPGSMSPDQFDKTIADLVNFLSYAAHPYQETQEWLGWWVLGFLLIFFVLAYYLKKEYWKDLKKKP
jgi:ubiquinol-cytochrome c reductase cytochrome c1 subunit